MIAQLLLSLAMSAPEMPKHPRSAIARPAEPFTGKFQIAYQPIYCVRASCPPGRYAIVMPGRAAVLVQIVDYDPATPVGTRIAFRGQGSAEGIGIDGQVRFVVEPGGRTIRAIVLAHRSVTGRWKP